MFPSWNSFVYFLFLKRGRTQLSKPSFWITYHEKMVFWRINTVIILHIIGKITLNILCLVLFRGRLLYVFVFVLADKGNPTFVWKKFCVWIGSSQNYYSCSVEHSWYVISQHIYPVLFRFWKVFFPFLFFLWKGTQ